MSCQRKSLCDFLFDGFFKGGSMDVSSKMNRAFAMDGIPSSGVGNTAILDFKTVTRGCLMNRVSNHFFSSFPGSSARSPSENVYFFYFVVSDINIQFRRTKFISIRTQPILAGKTASSGRRCYMVRMVLLAGGHHRYPLL